ncbi:MAG: ABC transporter permease [Bacillota bacterium]|nr:ABC transporter permease [Bacillota bacterium]
MVVQEALRNLLRQKGRTALTVTGIVIGIFALTVMGALAEKFNQMIANGERYFTHQISVYAAHVNGAPLGSNFFPAEKVEEIKRVPGVDEVAPEVLMLMEEETRRLTLGIPPLIHGTDLAAVARTRRGNQLVLREGRMPRPGERGWVVVGADLAFERKAQVGEVLRLRGRSFRVVGVADKTMTGPDRMAFVALEDAQALLAESQPYLRLLKEQAEAVRAIPDFWVVLLPPAIRRQLQAVSHLPVQGLATAASVGWKPGEDPEEVARRIRKAVSGVEVYSPAEMRRSLRQATLLFNLLILGSATIALVVGALAVINTMTMAVLERTREIGLKRALGARTADVLREYLLEAGLIGFLGGLAGVGSGVAFVSALNRWMAERGAVLFAATPRLELLGVVLATGLGVAAGVYPALRAARLDCVQALREE